VAAGISVVLIPLALWGRQFEPARRSLELASGDELLRRAGGGSAVAVSSSTLTLPPGP
jgi:hypothetical protein